MPYGLAPGPHGRPGDEPVGRVVCLDLGRVGEEHQLVAGAGAVQVGDPVDAITLLNLEAAAAAESGEVPDSLR